MKTGVSIGLAIASKLIPLIFLPAFLKRVPIKTAILIGIAAVGVALFTYVPFASADLLQANLSSGWLYFQRLEFNGSIYYLVREIGFLVKGYNIISSSGKWMAFLTFGSIISFSLLSNPRKVSLPESFMWILGIYLMFATTLHPWYIIPLLAFSVFTHYRFPIVWSYLIFWTYYGYSINGYEEPLILILVEYLIVYSVLAYELFAKSKGSSPLFEGHFKRSTLA